MGWSFLFVVSLAQGLFLLVVLLTRASKNPLAVRLLTALLVLFWLANFDDLLLSTAWYRLAPGLFGLSMGVFLAYGPLFWLYAKSITGRDVKWRQ